MAGNLGFAELKRAVTAGTIDTVIVAMVDMQGRLVGKRFQAQYFVDAAHKETHACDYLLADDIDMEPVPGYAAASWDKGYGDFVLRPDLATLRRLPWLDGRGRASARSRIAYLFRSGVPRALAKPSGDYDLRTIWRDLFFGT
jgi:glutamine synthetase